MKNIIILFSITLFHITLNLEGSQLSAQNVQSAPANFVIKKIKYLNSENKMKLFIDMEVTESEASAFTGIGVLSLCACYCDSIWDAWPSEVGGVLNIPGTGTLTYFSETGGNPDVPGLPRTAVLGIRSVEGGIERDSDFNVWLKYMLDE